MALYLAASDYLSRSDVASVGRLCARGTPDGTTVTKPVTAAALLTDAILAAALLDASGLVRAACLQGDRYLDADLAALTGNAQAALYRLVARLTTCLLWEDRALGGGDVPRPEFYEMAYDDLKRLEEGQRMF